MGAFPHIRYAAKSDIGLKRKNNEDSFGMFPAVGAFCVADGMGGGDDGEIASAATIRAIETFAKECRLPPKAAYPSADMLAGVRGCLNDASAWVFRRAKEKHLKGCGSTFVGVLFDSAKPDSAMALHAGDSRLYRIRGRSIQQVTKDHSAAELIGAKDESEVNPMFRGMILRAVGIQPTVEIDATPFPVREGDKIVICSDGLYRMVPDKKMLSIVRASDSVESAVNELIAAANAAGGVDNVTVELLEIGPLPPALPAVEMPKLDFHGGEGKVASTDAVTQDTNSENDVTFEAASADDSDQPGQAEDASESSAMTIPEAVETENGDETSNQDEASAPDAEGGGKAPSAARPKIVVVSIAAAVAVVLGAVIGMLRKDSGDCASAKDQRSEVVRQEKGDDIKALEERQATAAAQRERERRAEEEKAKAEEQRRLAEEKRRQEIARKEKEEADRLERIRVEREEARKAAERKAAEDAERERKRLAAEEAAREAKIREDELKRAAQKRADEERLRKEAEERRLQKLREAEDARRQKELDEQRRIRDEQAAMEAREKERHRKRLEVLSAFEEVCETDSADVFVRKVRGILGKDVPDEICTRFRPLRKNSPLSQDAKLTAAAGLTKDVQAIAAKLVDYAGQYLSDIEAEAEVADSRSNPEYRKELGEVPGRIKEFRNVAGAFVGKDPTDPDVQFKCILMIHSVPHWF